MRRTTLTLDEDVARKLDSETRRSGRPMRVVVNETLRRGFAGRHQAVPPAPFKVKARGLGRLRPGLALDNVAELLEQVEGPIHR